MDVMTSRYRTLGQGMGRMDDVEYVIRTNTQPSYIECMKAKIESSIGERIYSKGLGTVEPIFGIIENKML